MVFVTKYRRKVINAAMLRDLGQVFERLLERWGCELLEFQGEPDHVHLLVDAHPDLNLSSLVNNLKTISSRYLRKHHPERCAQFYRKPVLWTRSYCVISAGGAPLDILKRYIQNQAGTEELDN